MGIKKVKRIFTSAITEPGKHTYQVTSFTSNKYEFTWQLENCQLMFATNTAKSFISNEFTLNKTNQKCYLTLDIDEFQDNNETTGSNLTVTIGKGSQKTKLLIEVMILDQILEQHYIVPPNTVIVNKLRENCIETKSIRIPDNKMRITTELFKSLYLRNELYDVTFICGNENIQAHILVLSAVSSYFREMFIINRKEQFPCIIDLSNWILVFTQKYDLKILRKKALVIAKMHMEDLKDSKEFEKIFEDTDLLKELMTFKSTTDMDTGIA